MAQGRPQTKISSFSCSFGEKIDQIVDPLGWRPPLGNPGFATAFAFGKFNWISNPCSGQGLWTKWKLETLQLQSFPSFVISSVFSLRKLDKIYTMATGQNSESNVDMMDDFTLFRFNQMIKEKANLAPGKTPTLILTDSSGKKRLSFGNMGQLQEIREQKALIDAGSDISLSPSEEKDVKETEGLVSLFTFLIKVVFLSLPLFNCSVLHVLIICDTFFLCCKWFWCQKERRKNYRENLSKSMTCSLKAK